MKKILFTFFILLVFFNIFVFAEPQPQKRIKIAVLPFKNSTNYVQGDIGIGLSDMLVTELMKLKRFDLYERESIRAILNEQDFGATDRVEPSTAAQIGKIIGVDAVVIGNVTKYGIEQRVQQMVGASITHLATVSLDIRIVDTTTGEIILTASANGLSTRDIFYQQDQRTGQWVPVIGSLDVSAAIFSEASLYAIEDIITKIWNLFPLEGYIVKKEKEYALIDIGNSVAIQPGDFFEVYRLGEQIIHPVTGKIIDTNKTKIGEIKLTEILGPNLSRVLMMKGVREIQPGDIVVSVRRPIKNQTRAERSERDKRR